MHEWFGKCADVKNRRGKQAKGRKVTGVQFDPQDSSNLLVTSNDSRIRLYEGESYCRIVLPGDQQAQMPMQHLMHSIA